MGGHGGPYREVLDQDRPRGQDPLHSRRHERSHIATSETYESKESCLKGVAAVKRLAADAVVVEDAVAASTTLRRSRKAAPPNPAAGERALVRARVSDRKSVV